MYIGYRGKKIIFASPKKPRTSNDVKFFEMPDEKFSALQYPLEEYEIANDTLRHRFSHHDPKTLKIAIVSSFGTNCGMSTYAQYLTEQMTPLVKEIKIFAEYLPDEETKNDPPWVKRCWDRMLGNYFPIIAEIREFDPDIIYVQHEYGAFHHGANWNILIGNLSASYRTIVVLHAIYDHMSKLIFEAPCQEIITHSLSGRELLKKRGITHAPIHYIPHGCITTKQLNFKHSKMSSDHVIFQYGFGFEYKGWSQVIDIIDKLRIPFPEVTYIGIFNTSNFCLPFHNNYYDTLIGNIKERGLESNITLLKGFRSEDVLFSYMKQAKLNLFPYWNHPDWLVHGASGAVRLALASGTPTVVGGVPFFSELDGYVPVCNVIEEYVQVISKLFKDKKYYEKVKQGMELFTEQRSWDKIAKLYLECTPKTEFTAPVGGPYPLDEETEQQ